MLTDTAPRSSALFLFAHQDDEFGAFQQILEEQRSGRQVVCAYLTDGALRQVNPEVRNRESLLVLQSLGVAADSISFAGQALGIGDTKLPRHLEAAENWLRATLAAQPGIGAIYVPAWEGGHPDHDALHAVTVLLANELGLLDSVRQFSLYNGKGCRGPLFRVLRPLAANGASQRHRIPLRNRLRFLRLCLMYPSQRASWIGLFPFVALHYLSHGVQELQPVSVKRIEERPHQGALYYEKRAFFSWDEMNAALRRWQEARRPAAQIAVAAAPSTGAAVASDREKER